MLVVDPDGRLPTQAFFTTDLNMAPARVVELFVQRWSLEVTFEEVRRHLGVETQRQWNDGLEYSKILNFKPRLQKGRKNP